MAAVNLSLFAAERDMQVRIRFGTLLREVAAKADDLHRFGKSNLAAHARFGIEKFDDRAGYGANTADYSGADAMRARGGKHALQDFIASRKTQNKKLAGMTNF